MQSPNQNGVYPVEETFYVARAGRSYAKVCICQCASDALYRGSISLDYGTGGFFQPITDRCTGFPTALEARQAAAHELLGSLPKAWNSEPQQVHTDLAELRRQIEAGQQQPSLF